MAFLKGKYLLYAAAFLLAAAVLYKTDCTLFYEINETKVFGVTDKPIVNPFMGYAVNADNTDLAKGYSLVYIDITFRELQPESPDKFDFETIREENNISMWREQGKHAVLRFVCDKPSDESHTDIPDWLMEQTGDGCFYDTSYGKGYSPDYNNETFIYYHKKAIRALAEYFDDGFVSFVQMGSLGHWGEWHIKRNEGIPHMPAEKIREEYVRHYVDSFKNAHLMMRRPFTPVNEYGLGIFNDMIGRPESTEEWLSWIENGGEYSQTGEKEAMKPSPEFWKTAPSGGEFTSSIPMNEICGTGLGETISLLQKSHTTFIGPKIPVEDSLMKDAGDKILSSIGYRLAITEAKVSKLRFSDQATITLKWENRGIAPVYFDLPVNLYYKNSDGEFEEAARVDIKLTKILPGEETVTKTAVPTETAAKELYIGIIDPMTGLPAVELVSDQVNENGFLKIFPVG